jgi:AraC-like DNA-binding protein
MILEYRSSRTKGDLKLILHDTAHWTPFARPMPVQWLTIVWNTRPAQRVLVDEVEYDFPSNCILPLVSLQQYQFSSPANIIGWQFTRDFYCIVDHDKEIGCVGFLFFGTSQTMFLSLEPAQQQHLSLLRDFFIDEFGQADNIQEDMLRLLLARLIINITRIGKQQYGSPHAVDSSQFDLYRKFNLLVEINYKYQHEVRFYAHALNKSPKTLAHVFARFDKKPPSQVIHDRIILEAKRLFYYTDKSSKEICLELGFEDPSHFSKFFKRHTHQNATEFREAIAARRHP